MDKNKETETVMNKLREDLSLFTVVSNLTEIKEYYEEKIRYAIVMDDYDGGQVSAYREFVGKLQKTEDAICGLKQE